jgi:single-stranded DNA-binding protein
MACGTVSARTYTGSDGAAHATLELVANAVEFLTPKSGGQAQGEGFTQVDDDDLPEEFKQ